LECDALNIVENQDYVIPPEPIYTTPEPSRIYSVPSYVHPEYTLVQPVAKQLPHPSPLSKINIIHDILIPFCISAICWFLTWAFWTIMSGFTIYNDPFQDHLFLLWLTFMIGLLPSIFGLIFFTMSIWMSIWAICQWVLQKIK
jgi:hypothetical protein